MVLVIVPGMLDPFTLPFVQRGIVEVAVLALAAGLIGTWIVLRGLAFFSHAVGTAAFPGLVLADGLGFSAHLGAAGTAAVVAAAVGWLARHERERYDSLTALVLVAALALGVILASDVFHSGSNVETLLFGSLLTIDGGDIAWAVGAGVVVLAATYAVGPRWTATGFDPSAARALGLRSSLPDTALLALVALVAVAALSAVGALLATALLVVPAATTRLVCRRLRPWQLATVALTAVEGVLGLWLSVELNAPPGPAIAVLSGGVFTVVAVARTIGARRAAALTAAAGALALLAGCGDQTTGPPDGVRVVATTTQLGDLARAVGGDAARVTQILHPNTDPHDYEPRPKDIQATADADVILVSGDGLDAWMRQVLGQGGADVTPLDLGRRAPVKRPGDPHWWHDPRNVEAAIPAIRDALAAARPEQRATFERNAAAYLARLRRLDDGIRACVDAVAPGQRKLVTDHDAFGYFAARYGIQVVGAVLSSQTTQAQPSAGDVALLSRQIRRERVKAIFPESSLNPKLAEAIARQTGARSDLALYGDTLGPAGSDGDTYLGMERHNAEAIVRGFTGGARGCPIAGL
jgi:ABC-type Zn uptake system ZnuABC Zn-binding protein ZnuA/ABC-type Mn2+/Zn2+ transport system permease subunit